MSYFLGALLFIVILIGFFVIRNLLYKVETYEDRIVEYESTIILYQKYMSEISQAIKFSNEKLNTIDAKGTFKSDDEVGYFFKYLEEIQYYLNVFDMSKKIHANEPIKEVPKVETPPIINIKQI